MADRGDARAKGGRARGPLPELPGILRGLPGRPSWLGSLAKIAAPKECRFVDGVLETLTLSGLSFWPRTPVDDPRLATVKELKLVHGCDGRAVWNSRRLVSLKRVSGPSSELFRLGWDPLESTCRHASLSIL